MTNNTIPQIYLDEALRRLNMPHSPALWIVLARTLQELDWKAPVDPIVLTARSIVAEANKGSYNDYVAMVLAGEEDSGIEMKIALEALSKGMNMQREIEISALVNPIVESEGR